MTKLEQKTIARAQRLLASMLRLEHPGAPAMYRPADVARMMGVPVRLVHALIRGGKLAVIDVGGLTRVGSKETAELLSAEFQATLRAYSALCRKDLERRMKRHRDWFKRLTPQQQWRVRAADAASRRRMRKERAEK